MTVCRLPVECTVGDQPIRYLLFYYTHKPLKSEAIWSDDGECPSFATVDEATGVAVVHGLPLGRLWLMGLDQKAYDLRVKTSKLIVPYRDDMTFAVSRDEAERGVCRKLGGTPLVVSRT